VCQDKITRPILWVKSFRKNERIKGCEEEGDLRAERGHERGRWFQSDIRISLKGAAHKNQVDDVSLSKYFLLTFSGIKSGFCPNHLPYERLLFMIDRMPRNLVM
jgi:hypothetical protein